MSGNVAGLPQRLCKWAYKIFRKNILSREVSCLNSVSFLRCAMCFRKFTVYACVNESPAREHEVINALSSSI